MYAAIGMMAFGTMDRRNLNIGFKSSIIGLQSTSWPKLPPLAGVHLKESSA